MFYYESTFWNLAENNLSIVIYVAKYEYTMVDGRNVSHDQFCFSNFTFVSRFRYCRTYKHTALWSSYLLQVLSSPLPASHVYPERRRAISLARSFLIDLYMDMGPIVRSQIRNKRLHARTDVIPRVLFSRKMSKITAFPDGLRISHRKTPSALDFARSYASSTRVRGWMEWTGRERFREVGWTPVKRSGPFSRFVYFYAKSWRISLLLCSPERGCIRSS